MPSNSTQNYLKIMYSLFLSDGKTQVKGSELSKRLGISQAAVTDMIRRLASDGFAENVPYKGIRLTQKGIDIGRNMVRHHRIWEVFLHQELHIPLDQIHQEAEHLEHAGSNFLINQLDKKLGFPTHDPHGNPIPSRDGHIPPPSALQAS